MKTGALICDRGDRPQFLAHAKWLLDRQTRKADVAYVSNFKPKSDAVDLVERCRQGLDVLFNSQKCDVVLFWENDDCYSVDYIDTMLRYWELYNRPDLLGIGYTYYYHLEILRYRKLMHPGRASLFNTLISRTAKFEYPEEETRFLDLHLWKNLKGVTFNPEIISIGIKHGQGLCGGKGHNKNAYTARNSYDDCALSFLSKHIDSTSLHFYKSLSKNNSVAA